MESQPVDPPDPPAPAAPVAPPAAPAEPFALLPRVSRTFALGIRLLPPELSRAVGTAYLICRIADTIEDDVRLPPGRRQDLLRRYAGWLAEEASDPAPLIREFAAATGDDAALVRATGAVLSEFRRLAPPVQAVIRPPVEAMCTGMAAYVGRVAPDGAPAAPRDLDDLEQYCWYVAGTVGWMLTDLFRLADGRWEPDRYGRLRELSRNFGLGLQLTNVIRDIGEDRRRGVSFVPTALCAEAGCPPEVLFAPGREHETRMVLDALLARARFHLDAALEYCVALPRRSYRVRLFCLVPLFLAVGTLKRIGAEATYRSGWVRVKLPRRTVRLMVALAALVAPSNRMIRLAFERVAGRSRRRIDGAATDT